MATAVTIGGVDRTKNIPKRSLRINDIITRQVNTCNFTIQKYGSTKTFEPTVGQEVIVLDGATKIFAGNIVKITQGASEYKVIEYIIECADYGRQLDRFLINDSFTDQTIDQIIASIISDKGLDTAGFTQSNIDAPFQIAYIAFKYEPLSSVLTQLADLGGYDWKVDYDKDIYFKIQEITAAPFSLSDSDGSFVFKSLKIRRDNSQVKNVIYVRGGEYLGSNFTSEFISDASQNIWTLPYKYDTLQVNVTGEIWDGGTDGVDALDSVDYLWSKEEKFIRFRDTRIPSDTSSIKISGEPFLPVLVKLRDQASIDTMVSLEGGTGEYEFAIIDPSINSREGARERAKGELDQYKTTLSEGEFLTYTSGLLSGQKITVNSSAHGINEDFIISKIVITPREVDEFQYAITLISVKTFGIIEVLRSLLEKSSKDIVINENEILDVVESFNETLDLDATVTFQINGDESFSESLQVIETTTTVQSLDYEVEFVLGIQSPPSGFKRQFLISGSNLG